MWRKITSSILECHFNEFFSVVEGKFAIVRLRLQFYAIRLAIYLMTVTRIDVQFNIIRISVFNRGRMESERWPLVSLWQFSKYVSGCFDIFNENLRKN